MVLREEKKNEIIKFNWLKADKQVKLKFAFFLCVHQTTPTNTTFLPDFKKSLNFNY